MVLWSTKWLVLWSLWASRLVRQPTVTLQLSNGPVRGAVAPDGSHAMYTSIPYATVRERFGSPGPEPIWEDVFDAVEENIVCHQSIAGILTLGTKQCLTLNVYTPINTTPSSKVPVMVFIHGGGYFTGSGSAVPYGPNYLVNKGVILITVNYRLNIQGFLCLRIKEAPGNAGMKDQVAALRWVQKNIKQFGGDPDNVTIFGESAGGASVALHLYSPMSKGLFHKAVTQSGSSLSPWALQYRPVYLASALAKQFMYESQDPKSLYDFFMTRSDIELLLTKVPRKKGSVILSEMLFTPCIEKVIDGEKAFLTESPFDLLSTGNYTKVPMIIGSNNEEGLLVIGIEDPKAVLNITIETCLPKNLRFPSDENKTEVLEKLNELYMRGEGTTPDTLVNLARWIGEVKFNYPSLQETEMLMETNDNPIYNYVFQYFGNRNILKYYLSANLHAVKGATHADDIFYLFSQNVIPTFFENEIIDNVTTMWTNFAKYGDPTPDFTEPPVKWLRTNSTAPMSLVIDSELHTAPLWFNHRVKFLREVYSKFRRKHVSGY